MQKQIYKISILIVVVAFIGFAQNMAHSLGSNLPITQLSNSQTKNGSLAINKLWVGNMDSPQKNAKMISDGWLGLGLPITGSTNPTASLDVRGLVRLSDLKEKGKQVCANKDGDISSCGFEEFYYGEDCVDSGGCNKAVTTHKFTVPTGVNKITIELWGAGGMGYFYGSDSSNKAMDNTSANCFSGGGLWCPDGGSSYFYDKDVNGTPGAQIARSYGGKAPTSPDSGGTGGATYVNTSNIKVSNIVQNNGSNGGGGENGTSSSNTNINCGSNNYDIMIGGVGGNGGGGGGSGPNNSFFVVGGQGGKPGIPADCDYIQSLSNGNAFYGDNGLNGIIGAGGSGAGGHGGASQYLVYDFGTCENSPCRDSLKGFSGGGGGGYVSFDLNVQGGEVYTMKLSHGGAQNSPTYQSAVSGVQGCDVQIKWTCFSSNKSGYGGPGFARISY